MKPTTGLAQRIRLTVPDLSFDDVARGLREVVESGWLTGGTKLAEFERDSAKAVGCNHAVATSSGTTALHLALLSLGIGAGHEVIVPDYTFPATANAVLHCGARPVLVDVDPATYNLDPAAAAAHITAQTRAVMPVHQFGLAADMEAILTLARDHGLAVIEDAACALGATYRGRACGTMGQIACFSFHPRKVLTTGEGGLITTDDKALADFCCLWRNHGMATLDGKRIFLAAGYNFRMDELSAALGTAQIRRLDSCIERRRKLAAMLTAGLSSVPWLRLPVEPPDRLHVYQSYVAVLEDGVDRDRVIREMDALGVEAAPGAAAIHKQPYASRFFHEQGGDLLRSATLYERSITLPLYPSMTPAVVDRVVDAVRRVRV